ncbi:CoA pyrophosphatase [bacterium]|nr:MAG: CoA pyrophosphatase [bacterium]
MSGFITYLYERLREPLPGFEAQKLMMPLSDTVQNHSEISPVNCIPCSVLILLWKKDNDISVLLTLRGKELSTHKGQISFPGGKLEANESVEEGAIREAFEEVGILENAIRTIGRMSSFYMYHTNMKIQPIVAELVLDSVELELNEFEVSDAFWVRLEDLAEDSNIQTELWKVRNMELTVPFWNVDKEVPLWGATAMMLSELLVLYKEFKLTENRFSERKPNI